MFRLKSLAAATAALLLSAGPGGAAAGFAPARAGQDPEQRLLARAEAFFQALASGDPARFEAMAREHCAPGYLTRRTPDARRQMVERIKSDFGDMSRVRVVARQGGGLTMTVRGTTGLVATIDLVFEAAEPFRIESAGIRAQPGGHGGESEEPALAPPSVTPSMSPADRVAALDRFLSPLAADGSLSGVVLVARDGKTLFERAAGVADRTASVPISPATRFNVGSIGKMFTRTAIAQLVASGKLALTDTIGTLLPDYPNPDARVATVQHLLDHRAGIVDFFGPEFAAMPKSAFQSNQDYYRFVAPKPLLFAPGTSERYCNGCYVVLGAIVERVSGRRYEDYIAEHVFAPAGMTRAGFFRSDRFPADVAIGYTRQAPDARGTLRSNEQMHGVAGSAAGGAYATAADLLAFDRALRGRRLVDAAMTEWVLFSRTNLAIAGGAPGCNAVVHSNAEWTVVVVANLDPPAAQRVGRAIADAHLR